MEESVKTQFLNDCRPKYQTCKQLEDNTTMYITQCFTSQSHLKKTLSNLFTARDKLHKVKIKTEEIIAASLASRFVIE